MILVFLFCFFWFCTMIAFSILKYQWEKHNRQYLTMVTDNWKNFPEPQIFPQSYIVLEDYDEKPTTIDTSKYD